MSRVSHSVALHQPKQGKEEWKVTCSDANPPSSLAKSFSERNTHALAWAQDDDW